MVIIIFLSTILSCQQYVLVCVDEASLNQILAKLSQVTDLDKCVRNARQLQEFLENADQRVRLRTVQWYLHVDIICFHTLLFLDDIS